MRIVISGPPKQGHRWLKCILANVYELRILGGRELPDTRRRAVADWIAAGGLPDGTIMHQHWRFTPKLCDAIDAAPATHVTVVRDPYDTFVSFYYWVQDRAAHGEGQQQRRRRDAIIGRPLDHPDVLAFLEHEYGTYLEDAAAWFGSGRAVVVRYEGLQRDPVAEVLRVTDRAEPVAEERITAALEACHADAMRQKSQKLSRHVRSATVGDSRGRLSEAHLAIFRERHGDAIRALGYEVR